MEYATNVLRKKLKLLIDVLVIYESDNLPVPELVNQIAELRHAIKILQEKVKIKK